MKKGFALDDDRLKRLGGGNYFDELLARIRDIRSSEKENMGLTVQFADIFAGIVRHRQKAGNLPTVNL